MSADNAIVIARFKDTKGFFEYRVAHRQGIDNLDYHDENTLGHQATIVLYFGSCPSINTQSKANEMAMKLYDEIMDSDFPFVEYGIITKDFDIPFPSMTIEEANDIIYGTEE